MSNIKDALSHLLHGNLEEMRGSIQADLNERALNSLQEKKVELAKSLFTNKE